MKQLPVGIDDFRKVVNQYYYVDKTLFIKKLLDNHGEVTLITRPRRFGKTINMSMLDYFFSVEHKDNASLFQNLAISQVDEGHYLKEQNKYPVIFMTLKGVQNDTWEMMLDSFKLLMSSEYRKHSYVLTGNFLASYEKDFYYRILNMSANAAEYQVSLEYLMMYLTRYYHTEPIVLIDEYDAPLQYAYDHHFYDVAISYFRTFYNNSLKGNKYLKFAVLTGVLRIAKESIFSGLNNLEVDTVISDKYSDAFGFTLNEVKQICREYGQANILNSLKFWYDGYRFGHLEIYNPWSIINFFNRQCIPRPYWVNTSSNSIIRYLLSKTDVLKLQALLQLMEGKSIDVPINESVVYDDIERDKTALFTMLLTTGYLTISSKREEMSVYDTVSVKIPNEEIRLLYKTEILNHVITNFTQYEFDHMFKALLLGDKDSFERFLQALIEGSVSSFDTANRECFYHGLLLGILAGFNGPKFKVLSNRESGDGRFDIAIVPTDTAFPGVILELKYTDTATSLQKKAREALKQIHDKGYAKYEGFDKVNAIWHYGIAFSGKHLHVEMDS